ncbi:MAG: hypothetical protein E7507_03950 [Ruminococcus sp.]|nr:hypothetical protein [Ruminococcus sp.]
MLTYFLGYYLIEKGIITEDQFKVVAEKLEKDKVRLGTLAVQEKLLTEGQVADIHNMQMTENKKFGELAVQKEGLSEDDVYSLIKKQRSLSKPITHYLVADGVIAEGDVQKILEDFKADYKLTEKQFDDIFSNDFDTIISLLANTHNYYTNELYNVTLKFLIRFMESGVRIGKIEKSTSFSAERVVSQKVSCTESNFVIAFAGTRTNLHRFTSSLSSFSNIRNYDGRYANLFNFINCISCIFGRSVMRELSFNDTGMPKLFKNAHMTFKEDAFLLPVAIGDTEITIIVSTGKTPDFATVLHNM